MSAYYKNASRYVALHHYSHDMPGNVAKEPQRASVAWIAPLPTRALEQTSHRKNRISRDYELQLRITLNRGA
jgi:hypothetical protein